MTSFNLSTSAPNILESDSNAILDPKLRVEILRAHHKSVASTIEEESPESIQYEEECRPAESEQFLSPVLYNHTSQYASNVDNSCEKNSR